MVKSLMAAALLLAGAAPALAALPPHYQRQAELDAIVAEVVEMLGIDHPIDSIVMKGPDFYEVISGACAVEVQVVDLPDDSAQPMAGPRRFAVETGPVVCND